MDRSRLAILVAGAVSLAVALFALGAAVTSDDDTPVAAPTTVVAAVDTAAGDGSVPAATAPAATARLDIEIAGFKFGPAETTVQAGTEVVWTNNDGVNHSVVSTDGGFANSPTMNEGDTYALVFSEPGTYEYFCGFHDNMRGTITVEA